MIYHWWAGEQLTALSTSTLTRWRTLLFGGLWTESQSVIIECSWDRTLLIKIKTVIRLLCVDPFCHGFPLCLIASFIQFKTMWIMDYYSHKFELCSKKQSGKTAEYVRQQKIWNSLSSQLYRKFLIGASQYLLWMNELCLLIVGKLFRRMQDCVRGFPRPQAQLSLKGNWASLATSLFTALPSHHQQNWKDYCIHWTTTQRLWIRDDSVLAPELECRSSVKCCLVAALQRTLVSTFNGDRRCTVCYSI